MKKNVTVVLIGVILIVVAFCGCQSSKVENDYETIFESDVINLIYYTMETKKSREDDIVEVSISGMIENIVDRQIDVIITAEFYDKDDNYIGESSIQIFYLRSKPSPASSTTFPPPFLTYSGKNVDKTDHIRLRAEEYP